MAIIPSNFIVLGVPLTHSDWMLRPNVQWGANGVRYMLDQCKASGWTRVYWRAFDGGRANYFSKLADPSGGKWDDDNYYNPKDPADYPHAYWMTDPTFDRGKLMRELERLDYSTFDSLDEAVRYGHAIGLEIHVWLTINEDDHAWGMQSRFTKANPHSRWRRRDGRFFRSQQSFAFESVRQYKLALIEEILSGYDVDGVFLDWMRTGDTRDDPQNDEQGVADFGYEKPLVRSFQERYGIDPHTLPNDDERWIAWRTQPTTEFMRSVRKLMKARNSTLPLAVMGQNPWSYRGLGHRVDGNLRGLLLDFQTWAREGLVDTAVAAGYYRDGGSAEKAYLWLRTQTLGLIDVWTYAWVPETIEGFQKDLELARRHDVQQMLLWEADYIDARANKAELQSAMSSAAGE